MVDKGNHSLASATPLVCLRGIQATSASTVTPSIRLAYRSGSFVFLTHQPSVRLIASIRTA